MSVIGLEAGYGLGLELQAGGEPFPDREHVRAIGTTAFDCIVAIHEQGDPYADLELSLDVTAALATLPAAQREILRLRYVEGLTVDDAASQIGIPVGTASTRSWHALRKLRAHFTPPGESQPVI